MHQESVRVKLLNLLLSLSDALELANSHLSQHQLRTAFISWEISKTLHLPDDATNNLFVAALLHDVGALSPEEKIEILKSETIAPEPHCILGEKLLNTSPLLNHSAEIIRRHHDPWEIARDFSNDKHSFVSSQIVHLADTVDRLTDRSHYILHINAPIIQQIKDLSGTDLDPVLVDAFAAISQREDFWLDLVSPRLYSILLNHRPCRNIEINFNELLDISKMFRDLIDFRSRFTATHSSGVATAASILCEKFGLTTREKELMWIAGNFHDLGKMAVPNSILNKNGKLTTEEFAVMRQHTYHTYTILSTIGGISQIAEWAAFHHEHLDGSGYPFHVDRHHIVTNSRLMAVADVFTALSEERPYRPPMKKEDVVKILLDMAGKSWLDGELVALIDQNYDEISFQTREAQAESLAYYQNEFAPIKIAATE